MPEQKLLKKSTRSNPLLVYINSVMCLGVIYCSVVYENDLIMLRNCKYVLALFCLVDIYRNSREMVLHHIATIFLGYILHVASHTNLEPREIYILTKTTTVLMQTEVSTLPLNLFHLGYKNSIVKSLFVSTFFYFRMIRLPWYLISSSYTCYYCAYDVHTIEKINLEYMWIFSTLTLMGLNTYWMNKIVRKILG